MIEARLATNRRPANTPNFLTRTTRQSLSSSCDLLAPAATAPFTAPSTETLAATTATRSLLEALALGSAPFPVLRLPVHLARSGAPALRRLSRAFGTLCALLGGGLIGTTTTGFLVVLLLLLGCGLVSPGVLVALRLVLCVLIYRVPVAVIV